MEQGVYWPPSQFEAAFVSLAHGPEELAATIYHALDIPLDQLGPTALRGEKAVKISTTCTVFAESEVINCLSQGSAPADIMHGAIVSLVDRSVQLMKRVQMEPEYTLVGGILRFETMARVVSEQLKSKVNVPAGDMPGVARVVSSVSSVQHYLVVLRGVMLRGADLRSLWAPGLAFVAAGQPLNLRG